MVGLGYFQPLPATAALWAELAAAKASGDRVEVGRLSDAIRRQTMGIMRDEHIAGKVDIDRCAAHPVCVVVGAPEWEVVQVGAKRLATVLPAPTL